MTWLLVEDDPDIRNFVQMVLTVWGHKPLPFPDGKTAWAWLDSVENGTFQGELPEFALMDIKMPGHTGDEIAARIRRTDKIKNIPVVLMTAYSLSESEITEMRARAGFDNLINKPLPELERLQRMLYDVRDKRLAAVKAAAAAPDSQAAAPASVPSAAPTPSASKDGATPAKPVQASTAAEAKRSEAPSAPKPAQPTTDTTSAEKEESPSTPKPAGAAAPEAKKAEVPALPAQPTAPAPPTAPVDGVHPPKPAETAPSKPSEASAAKPETPSVSQSKTTKPKS